MTPRALDTAATQAKLRLMRELLDDLETIGEVDGARLRQDPLLRLAVERVLTQLVDLAASSWPSPRSARRWRGASSCCRGCDGRRRSRSAASGRP